VTYGAACPFAGHAIAARNLKERRNQLQRAILGIDCGKKQLQPRGVYDRDAKRRQTQPERCWPIWPAKRFAELNS